MRLLFLSSATCIAGFAFARLLLPPATDAQNAAVVLPSPVPVIVAPPPPPILAPAEKPTREQLRKALSDKDIFRGAHDAAAWIDTATVEDFRAFIKDPRRFPRSYFAGFDDDFQNGFLDAFMERWLTLAPEDIGMIEKNDSDYSQLLRSAARAVPTLFLSNLSPDGKSTPFDRAADIAFESLASRDYRAARRILDSFKDQKTKDGYELAVLRGLAKNDPLSAASLLQGTEFWTTTAIVEAAERIGLGTLRQLFANTGGKYDTYPGLPRLLLRYPDLAADLGARAGTGTAVQGGPAADENLIRDADQTPAEARAKILTDYENLPPASRDALCAALVAAWARTEPRAAIEWAVAHAKADDADSRANTAAQYAFLRWVSSDAKAAFTWWQALPPSAMRDALGMEASTHFAEDGDFETAKTLFRYVPGSSRRDTLSHFASLYAQRDAAGAAGWLATLNLVDLPPYNQYPNPVSDVVPRYFSRDPEGAAQWAESLPAGTLRDQSLAHVAIKIAQTNPSAAVEWLGKITDPKTRTGAAQWIVNPWKAEDPAAARAWVATQTVLDEKFRVDFLKQ